MLWIVQLLFSRSIFCVFAFTCLLFISSAAVSVQASATTFEPISLISSGNHYQLNSIECPKSDLYSEVSGHHCCGSVCMIKIPNNQSISTAQLSLPLLAPLGLDDIGKAITRSRTLFRPPIV